MKRQLMARQRGMAVILAMLIVAAASVIATALLSEEAGWFDRVSGDHELLQARLLAASATRWAAAVLFTSPHDTVTLQQPWAQVLPVASVENSQLGGFITDAQGRFNLANLTVQDADLPHCQAQWLRLMQLLGIPETLAKEVMVWQQSGAPLRNLAELQRLRGFSRATIARIAPWLVVLPEPTPVNANTASAELLSAMLDGVDLSDARALVEQRDATAYDSMSAFRQAVGAYGVTVRDQDWSVQSAYFMVRANVTYGTAHVRLLTLLHRVAMGWPQTVSQELL